MAHAKSRGHLFQSEWSHILHYFGPLDKPTIPKTAFNSPFDKFEYVKVPFGLAQAPTYFQ